MTSTNRSRPAPTPTRRDRRRAERTARAARAGAARPAGRSSGGPSLALISTVIAIVAGLALIGFALSQQRAPAGGTSASSDPNAALVAPSITVPGDLGDTPAQLGDPNAPIQMEITEDYQCPICARFTNEQLPRLVDDFVRPGLVHVTVHDVAYLDYTGSESLDSATAAACAGEQGRYWEYHEWLYANQHGEREGAFARSRLDEIARRIDLDTSAYDACMSAGTEQANVKNVTKQQLAKGINSTPTFVINGGQPIPGLPTYQALAGYLRSLLPSGAASPSAPGSGPASPSASG